MANKIDFTFNKVPDVKQMSHHFCIATLLLVIEKSVSSFVLTSFTKLMVFVAQVLLFRTSVSYK